jgi:hypothetical protein
MKLARDLANFISHPNGGTVYIKLLAGEKK